MTTTILLVLLASLVGFALGLSCGMSQRLFKVFFPTEVQAAAGKPRRALAIDISLVELPPNGHDPVILLGRTVRKVERRQGMAVLTTDRGVSHVFDQQAVEKALLALGCDVFRGTAAEQLIRSRN